MKSLIQRSIYVMHAFIAFIKGKLKTYKEELFVSLMLIFLYQVCGFS